MAKTLILHIGHYKTGTTAVQVFAHQNDAALARAGVTYAATQRHLAKHSTYAFALLRAAGVKTLMHGYANPAAPEVIWAPLLAEVRAAPTPAVLISSEEFIRLAMAPPAVDRLRATLATAPDIRLRIIVYVRPIAQHLRSWYNQMVKMRACRVGFQTAVCQVFEGVHTDYGLALGPWAELAGPGGLVVRPYDDALRQGDAMYRDFCAALGVAMPPGARLPAQDPNPRVDDRVLDLMRAALSLDVPTDDARALTDHARAWLDAAARRAQAERAAMDAVRARAAQGLDRVAALAGEGFPLARFQAALPGPEGDADRDRAALIDALMHDRARLQRELADLRARQAPDAAS